MHVDIKMKLAPIPVTPFSLFAVLDNLFNFLSVGCLFYKIDMRRLNDTMCKVVSEFLTIQTNAQQIIAI